MSARKAWRRTYHEIRRDLRERQPLTRGHFPPEWAAASAALRLEIERPGLGPVPARVAVALFLSARSRREGDRAEARRYVRIARTANIHRAFAPALAIGA